MEKHPLKGNNKPIALQSLVGGPNKNMTRSGNSSSSSTGVTYQSVNKNKKVMCSHKHCHHSSQHSLSLFLSISLCLYLSIELSFYLLVKLDLSIKFNQWMLMQYRLKWEETIDLRPYAFHQIFRFTQQFYSSMNGNQLFLSFTSFSN